MKRPHYCGAALLAAAVLVCLVPTTPALADSGSLFTIMPFEAGLDTGSPAAVDARRVQIDASALEGEAQRIILPRFDGPALEAVLESIEFRGPGDLAWRGWVHDGAHKHNVTLTLKNGYVIGLIMSPDGAYELAPLADGGQAFVKLNTELYPPCGTEEDPSLGAPPVNFEAAEAPSTVARPTRPASSPAEGTTVIDVMVVYTKAARVATGGTAEAAIKLVRQTGGEIVGATFVIDTTQADVDANGVSDMCENIGTSICGPAVPNSTMMSGEIAAYGSPFAGDRLLELEATNLPDLQFGYFLASQSNGLIVGPGGSQGNLCVTGTIGRFVSQVDNTAFTGSLRIIVDTSGLPGPLPASISAGETWYFQAWFRDVNPTPTSNFSDAVCVVFQ